MLTTEAANNEAEASKPILRLLTDGLLVWELRIDIRDRRFRLCPFRNNIRLRLFPDAISKFPTRLRERMVHRHIAIGLQSGGLLEAVLLAVSRQSHHCDDSGPDLFADRPRLLGWIHALYRAGQGLYTEFDHDSFHTR